MTGNASTLIETLRYALQEIEDCNDAGKIEAVNALKEDLQRMICELERSHMGESSPNGSGSSHPEHPLK